MNLLERISTIIDLCGIIFYPLSALFIVALAIIIDKILTYKKTPKPSAIVKKLHLEKSHNFEQDLIDCAKKTERNLNSGLWVLETIITAAPLLGLLGTIIGMMDSFKLIGENGLVNPSGVTAGVAQALIATAYGLFIAIFSLFAFNFFAQKKDLFLDEIEWLGNRKHNDQ